jgi:hypothetical protein
MSRVSLAVSFAALAVSLLGCGSSSTSGQDDWAGTIDTLPSGQIVVANTAEALWVAGSEWQVIEEVRIGTREGTGPDIFGRITSIEVDATDRVYVLEAQSQELRVFDHDGAHVRTIGRKGGGPGEFARAVMVRTGPDGNIWVPDPENNRVSAFDTAGTVVFSRPAPGGFIILPWPGGFDDQGFYYSPVFVPAADDSDQGFHIGLAQYDSELQPVDTLFPPDEPYDLDSRRFELRSADGSSYTAARIPFSPTFRWRFEPDGTFWGLVSGDYRLFQLNTAGDTLRTISREFEPYPVTDEEIDAALERLDWFTQRGGKVVRSRIPSKKPPTEAFFFDDEGNLWVVRVTTAEDEWRVMDVFDPIGRYLGEVRLPFRLSNERPVVRGADFWAVTTDELDVPYVVRGRIVKSGDDISPTMQ